MKSITANYKSIIVNCITVTLLFTGCNLLETKSNDEYSGQKFWAQGNVQNVEAFTLSIYNSFRKATLVNSAFMTVSGDFRCAPVLSTGSYISYLTANNMSFLANTVGNASGWNFLNLTRWKPFYEVVQSANILIEEVERVPGITDDEIAAYSAEAVFMRNLAYFFMVRAWGDVPYYTNAYNSVSLPRTGMVTVLQNCLVDLQDVIDSDPDARILPWTYATANKRAVRASRGSVVALMMHVNMWLAQFDQNNSDTYYRNTVQLGNELVTRNEGAYELLALSQNAEIFAGASRESIFDVVQDVGMNEVFLRYANFSDAVSFSRNNLSLPVVYYNHEFIEQLFPRSEIDLRVTTWFDEELYSPISGIMNSNNRKEIIKFFNPAVTSDNVALSNSGNCIIFRYADAILLYAEALAETGNDATACTMLNMIRRRAGASEVNATGTDLKDTIFWERLRELIGEGHYYYDMVRTGKISNMNYCENYIPRSHFNAGAWTLPIHADALIENTKMTLNNYWVN